MNEYTCLFCNKAFKNRKPNKIYCSKKCYFSAIKETWRIKRSCVECHNPYIPTHKKQKYCGHDCSSKVNGKKQNSSISIQCMRCSKDFFRRKSAVSVENFCSWACRKAPTVKKCEKCENFFPTGSTHWKTSRFCSRSCAKSGENHHYYGKQGPTKGMKTWMFGLRKETDKRVAEMAEKISKKSKEQFALGIRSNKGERNPNYGKTPDMRTPDQLDRYSKASIDRVKNSKYTKHRKYIRGVHFSLKAGKQILFKSSYEKRMMNCLEKDTDVLTYEYESITINYGNKRYLPDFLVTFTNGNQHLIETKGTQFLYETATLKKTEAAIHYCEGKNIEYRIYSGKELKEYETKLNIVFSLCDLRKELKEIKHEY